MTAFLARTDEELLQLLGRFSPGTGEWERREILALPEDTRALVLRRVDVLDRYLALEKGSAAAADAAAEALSMPRSNFYRLLARYRQVGAVLGLVPHARIPKPGRPGGAYDFSVEVERLVRAEPSTKLVDIMEALSKSRPALEGASLPSRATIQRQVAALHVPHAQIPKPGSPGGPYDFSVEIERLVRAEPGAKLATIMKDLSKSAPALEGAPLPSRATIQRRVAALRSATQAPPQALGRTARRDVRFARDILIDQCALDVLVRDGPLGARIGIAFVLDLDTRLVIGVGLGPLGDGLRTMAAALADSDEFWSSPLLGSIPASRMPDRVEWVPPPGSMAVAAASAINWGVADATDSSPDRRHGARLVDVIGAEFAHYRLLTFVGDGSDAKPRLPAEPLISVAGALSKAIDEWNVEIVRRHEGARLVLRGPTWDKRIAKWTSPVRVSDLDGGELSLLLTGSSLPPDASKGAVRTIWQRWTG